MSQPVSTMVQAPLPTSIETVIAITTTTSLPPPPPQPQQSTADLILVRRIGELKQHIADLLQDNLALGERLDKHGTRLYNLDKLDIPHKEEARKKQQKRRDAPRSPPGSPPLQPPPLAGTSGALGTSRSLGSSQLPLPLPPLSTGISGSTLYKSTGIAGAQEISPLDDLMHDDSGLDEQASALASSYEPPAENSLLAKTGDMMTFLNWYCRQINKSKLTQANLEGQAYEVVKIRVPIYDGELLSPRPLIGQDTSRRTRVDARKHTRKGFFALNPLLKRHKYHSPSVSDGGVSQDAHISGHVTIQTEFFFNKDLEYLRFGNKESMPVLSIFKMKAAHYPDFAYSRYGYDYLSEIVLRRADFQEYMIAKKVFKNLYPSDFEDLNFLLLQGHLDHLSGSDKRMLSTAVKLWTRNLVIRQRLEDFQLGIESYQT
ncbi:hypothetical protein Tco_0630720 [Tanacetum coccineum]